MQRSPWEANHSLIQDISRLLWNLKLHYYIHRSISWAKWINSTPRSCVTSRNVLNFLWRSVVSSPFKHQCRGMPLVGCPRFAAAFLIWKQLRLLHVMVFGVRTTGTVVVKVITTIRLRWNIFRVLKDTICCVCNTFVPIYSNTQCHNPEVHSSHFHHHEYLKFRIVTYRFSQVTKILKNKISSLSFSDLSLAKPVVFLVWIKARYLQFAVGFVMPGFFIQHMFLSIY
jgi:hypothetical protein